ncbi:hypothetical protein [Clostridium sp. AM58-1XD]|uniref:hypothetical protein n=1 Tax=Clostridium sp. AM58-1XD TaxID=2292307 RepID=UPI000E4E1FB8|nr:hypothetical protein [Clostridium sp. AM58-1XD]RGY98565.1 hypothetical protein DXA13_10820 [Clostridium sp. AM58-1XD]
MKGPDGGSCYTERLKELADSYVPEWKYSPDAPDLGTAAAELFLELMEGNEEKWDEFLKKRRDNLFFLLGSECTEGRCAEGYLVFELASMEMDEAWILAGSRVMKECENGKRVSYLLQEHVQAAPWRVKETVRSSEGWEILLEGKRPSQAVNLFLMIETQSRERKKTYGWKFLGRNGWEPMNVIDGTENLMHSGLVCFPAYRDWEEIPCKAGKEYRISITAEDGTDGTYFAVFANGGGIRAEKTGEDANTASGGKWKLEKSAGFVSKIRNPEGCFGGIEGETAEQKRKRQMQTVRHQEKTVTPADYEAVIKSEFRNIEKIRCFPGYGEEGKKADGEILVAFFIPDEEEGHCCYHKWAKQIYDKRKDPRLHLTAAWRVRLDIQADLAAADFSRGMELADLAEKRLASYLDPVTGGKDGSGWKIGQIPGYSQIRQEIQRIPGISYVKRMRIAAFLDRGYGQEEIDIREAAAIPWILPISGKHEIHVTI